MSGPTTRTALKKRTGLMHTLSGALPRDVPATSSPKLIIMVGGPGSGKTSVGKLCAEKCDVKDAIVLNPDSIAESEEFAKVDEDRPRAKVNEAFRDVYERVMADKQGVDIIYDRTGAYEEHTQFVVNLIHRLSVHKPGVNYEVILCIALAPVEVGLERVARREETTGRSVPPIVTRRIYSAIDDVLEGYATNAPIRLFANLGEARDNLAPVPTRIVRIKDGDLVLPTVGKGRVRIPYGQYAAVGMSVGRASEFPTPERRAAVTVEGEDEDDDAEITKNAIIRIQWRNGKDMSFQNAYQLFDKVIMYDNSDDQAELVYYYDNGQVLVDRQLQALAASARAPTDFRILDTLTAAVKDAKEGRRGGSRARNRKKGKTKRRNTRRGRKRRKSGKRTAARKLRGRSGRNRR